jgi:hypothetical protein
VAPPTNYPKNIDTTDGWKDPIVNEVRKVRDRIAAEHQYDVRAIGRYYQRKQTQSARTLVTRAPRRIEPPTKNP